MNRAQLFTHFDRISDAPDAIPRLRRFLLDLAVRGKLVEQDPRDEPASELLNRIRVEKARLVRRGEIRKENLLPQIEVQPYEIPKGWEWTRLGNTGRIFNGNSVSESEKDDLAKVTEGYPFIATKDVGYGRDMLAYENGIMVPFNASGCKVAHGQAVLICAEGGSAGKKVGLTDRDICFGNKLYANEVWPGIHPRYILSLYQTTAFFNEFAARMTGIIGGIARSEFLLLPVPIPPESEQHRIVAKVDELMALCDRLEVAQAERESRRDRLTAASLQRLNNGADPDTFREHARFCCNRLLRLTTRLEHIQQLRQTIFSLAVCGQLVPQDPKDKPAPLFAIEKRAEEENRIQLRLPLGWSWARVEDVAEARLGKMLDKAKNSGKAHRYLRNTNIHWFDVRMDELKDLRIEANEVEKYVLRNGDVLICEGGHGIGRTAVWRGMETDIIFQKALHRVRPSQALNSEFFAYCVCVYFHAGVLQSYFTGVGIPHFTGVALSKLVFPLPPIKEQDRIVAKVEELMDLCDRLEAQLTTTQAESRRLLEATLHHALSA